MNLDLYASIEAALYSPTAIALYLICGTLLAAAVILFGSVVAWDEWRANAYVGKHRPQRGRKAVAL